MGNDDRVDPAEETASEPDTPAMLKIRMNKAKKPWARQARITRSAPKRSQAAVIRRSYLPVRTS